MKKLYSLLFVLVALVAIGAYQTVNVGSNPNDGTGDTLRSAFQKVNANFTQVTADFVASTNFPGYGAWLTNWDSRTLFFTNGVVGGNSFQWNFNGVDQSLELDANGFTVFTNFYPGWSIIQGQGGTNIISDSGSSLNFIGLKNGNLTAQNIFATNTIFSDNFQGLTSPAGALQFFDGGAFLSTSDTSSYISVGALEPNMTTINLSAVINSGTLSVPDGSVTATNFIHTTWKWVDILQSGTAIASNPSGDPPILTEIPGGSNFFGYAYYYDSPTAGDKSYFSIQGIHKFASTNATHPNLWFEPHIHVTCTNMPANLSNVTFRLDLAYATVFGRYTNGYVHTNTFSFTNVLQHGVLSFGNVTNNALSGRSSVLFKGRIMRVNGGDGDLGANNPVWVDSLDIHMPTTELGSTGQGGD